MNWYRLSSHAVIGELRSDEGGLSLSDAKERLLTSGANKLPEAKSASIIEIFFRQFASPIIYILLSAALIVFAMGDVADSMVILAVLVTNAVVGAIQEGKAQNTLSALRSLVATNASVLRGGIEMIIRDTEVVPGDILILKEGDKIPADARILEADSLFVDESALTGESIPVPKVSEIIHGDALQAADQRNMIFRGTFVVGGQARAIVVATGLKTEIGSISAKLVNIETEVPLRKNIRHLSKIIIISVLSLCVVVFLVGLLKGIGFKEMFSTVVAMAVSATPEGLPVVVTVILATGMYRMNKRNALVKQLQAVEALGQAKVIAVDKTGTITLNQMMVEELYLAGKVYEVTGNGYEPSGEIREGGHAVESLNHPDILLVGRIAALTASASIVFSEEKKEWQRISGDPTEAALLAFSEKVGFKKVELEREYAKILEIPFNSGTQFHAVLHDVGSGKNMLSVAGAPERILDRTTHIWRDGSPHAWNESDKVQLENELGKLLRKGLRVIALAVRFDVPAKLDPNVLPELAFVAFVGIADSLRNEVYDAVKYAQAAGVKVVVITGDHMETAKSIAAKVGIYKEGDKAILGRELHEMKESELAQILPKITVFARVAPDDKMKIIEAYRRNGEIIAMTGDGVNDALPLAAADLGVSMGKIGTEVAKEASDIVLTDDNLGSIVAAIEEGRNIYHTIKKVILYLFSTSLGEILAIAGAIFLGYPVPVTPSQIIWLNFVTDGFLVVALAMEPKENGLLGKDGLKNGNHKLLDRTMIIRMIIVGAIMMLGSLYMFNMYQEEGYIKASTAALTVLAVFQWFNVWNCKSSTKSVFVKGMFENRYLIGATFIVMILQYLALTNPFLQKILHTTPLNFRDMMLIVSISLLILFADELRKFIISFFKKDEK